MKIRIPINDRLDSTLRTQDRCAEPADPVLFRCGDCRVPIPESWQRVGYCLVHARARDILSPQERAQPRGKR